MKTLHMIGNAHLDPVWLWDWREGYQENQATILSAIQRLEEFPDFVFTCSSAQFYEWIEDSTPELFVKIEKYIKEGRWVIVGGWWVQPDCNVPSGESFARHALISQTYFKEHFGIKAETGYNVDSFGHNGMLPQILRKSGMKNYVFMRPGNHENEEIPNGAFVWESPDGSQVTTFRIPGSYGFCKDLDQLITAYPDQLPDWDTMMMFYGVGNHGGGPTIENIKSIHKVQQETDLDVRFSDPNTFFKSIEGRELPVWKGEMQHHAPGCYAAESMVKTENRRAENALLRAEKMMTLAENFGYPQNFEPLTGAWKNVLFNQFHDILAGSSKEAAYYDTRNQLGEASAVADRLEARAVRNIAFHVNIPLDPATLPLMVLNPHSWDVKAPVEFETGTFANALNMDAIQVVDSNGQVVAHQFIDAAVRLYGRRRITFIADVPALGYATYFLKAAEPNPSIEIPEDFILENDILKVTFDQERGSIASILDKRTGSEILAAPVRATIIADDTDTWGHSLVRLDQKIGEMKMVRYKVMDRGDVRQCLKVTTAYGDSTLIQVYSLYEGDNKILVDATVNWQEHRKALKLEFPVVGEGQASCEMPFGHTLKKMDGKEEPMQQWADISSQGVGLSVINDGKYSVDFHENTIGMTILRSPVYAHHDPYVLRDDEEYSYMDQGIQHFRYALLPHDGCWRKAGVMKEAALLNQPLRTAFETFHEGPLPQRGGGMSIDKDNIIMTALKKAYRGEDLILRIYESWGIQTCTEITLFGNTFRTELTPYEIQTLAISQDGRIRTVNLLEEDYE